MTDFAIAERGLLFRAASVALRLQISKGDFNNEDPNSGE